MDLLYCYKGFYILYCQIIVLAQCNSTSEQRDTITLNDFHFVLEMAHRNN